MPDTKDQIPNPSKTVKTAANNQAGKAALAPGAIGSMEGMPVKAKQAAGFHARRLLQTEVKNKESQFYKQFIQKVETEVKSRNAKFDGDPIRIALDPATNNHYPEYLAVMQEVFNFEVQRYSAMFLQEVDTEVQRRNAEGQGPKIPTGIDPATGEYSPEYTAVMREFFNYELPKDKNIEQEDERLDAEAKEKAAARAKAQEERAKKSKATHEADLKELDEIKKDKEDNQKRKKFEGYKAASSITGGVAEVAGAPLALLGGFAKFLHDAAPSDHKEEFLVIEAAFTALGYVLNIPFKIMQKGFDMLAVKYALTPEEGKAYQDFVEKRDAAKENPSKDNITKQDAAKKALDSKMEESYKRQAKKEADTEAVASGGERGTGLVGSKEI